MMSPIIPDEVLTAANKQARELGVDASQCLITISQDSRGGETRWRVNYGAKEAVGRRGGDLIVDVNPTDYSIAKVLRGQ
jgi:hypothetical protein